MKILVTGATGYIGSHLCHTLREAGHSLIGLSRDPILAQRHLPVLQQVFSWDPLRVLPPPEALEGIDAVIHLAGERVAGRWTAAKKRAIRDSRILSTRHLVETLKHLNEDRPKALISASAIGYYGHRGEESLTEDSSPGSDFLANVCRAWEEEASRAQDLGLRVVRLRTGIVLGPGGGALQAMLPLFKFGLGGPLGSGRQWWSWVHREDVVGLIIHALEKEVSGPLNATVPQPVRQKEFAQTLGRLLRRPAVLPTPSLALKVALGGFSSELLSSKRVISQKAQEAGYRFRSPELEPALRDALGLPQT
jgi:uncharacterized protein (TIGR01777 family)